MKVIVTGGTGFIGRELQRALTERGDSVVVLTRGASGVKDGIETQTWDPRRGRDREWMKCIDGSDAVVHLAGAGVLDERWNTARLEVIRSSRTDSTALVAEAIVAATVKPRAFVSASAVGIYGMSGGSTLLDEDGRHGNDVLARVCEDWESSAGAARDVCRVTHPRIGVALGEGGGALERMIPAFRAFVGGPVGTGRQYVSWIHQRDVVRAILFAIDTDALVGAYNVVAPTPCTMAVLAETLGRVLHRPAVLRVPAFALRMILGDSAEVVLTGQRCVPRKLLELGFRFEFSELEPALKDVLDPPH